MATDPFRDTPTSPPPRAQETARDLGERIAEEYHGGGSTRLATLICRAVEQRDAETRRAAMEEAGAIVKAQRSEYASVSWNDALTLAAEGEDGSARAVLEQVAAWLENYGPGCSRSFRRDFSLASPAKPEGQSGEP